MTKAVPRLASLYTAKLVKIEIINLSISQIVKISKLHLMVKHFPVDGCVCLSVCVEAGLDW